MTRRQLKGMAVIWRKGGAWERFFLLWPWLGFIGYFGLMTWAALLVRSGPQEFERVGVVSVGYLLTIYPAAWAGESAATLRGLKEAGLEPEGLSNLQIEYLERFGKNGTNPTARVWAAGYVLVYLAWTVFALAASKALWPTPLEFIVIHVAFSLALVGVFVLRLRAFFSLAASRGYPFYQLALELRKQGLRR